MVTINSTHQRFLAHCGKRGDFGGCNGKVPNIKNNCELVTVSLRKGKKKAGRIAIWIEDKMTS